jgi:hypothetical protein
LREKIFGIILLALIIAGGCAQSGSDSPKETVIKLFGAMERNETATIAHILDIPALMRIRGEDYALTADTPRVFHNPMDILDDLTGTGLTKTRWFSMQRIIGETEVRGDSAFVEVSFISKATNIQYYNKFGLHRENGRWKIHSFKTISSK